jgi:hypothetical protein
MKQRSWIILTTIAITCASLNSLHARRLTSLSQTYLFTRPAYDYLAGTEPCWDEESYGTDELCTSGIQMSGFFAQSNNESKVNEYFMFDKKDTLLVSGESGTSTSSRQIRAEWLGLGATFSDKITIKPKIQQFGGVLQAHKCIGKYLPSLFKRVWLEATIPFLVVKNDLQLTAPQALTDSLNKYDYAKFSTKELSRTNVAEVLVQIGTSFINKDGFLLSTRSGIIIPTASTPLPTNMFNPTMGPNGHLGFQSNINAQLPLTADDTSYFVGLVAAAQQRYYLPNNQRRVLDLKSKPWSRYLLLRKGEVDATTPGINVLTQQVKVDPYNHIDLYGGLRLRKGAAQLDFGYNLWVHPTEQLTIIKDGNSKAQPDFTAYGIAHTTDKKSASASTVKTLGAQDATFTYLKESDLDLDSGASQGTSTHRLSSSLAIHRKGDKVGTFAMISGFYEVSYNWAGFHQWGAWAKIGVTW